MTWDEIEELACLMLGKDYDSLINDYDESVIDSLFYNEYNLDLSDFWHILEDLVKFTPTWRSPITNELYQGFVVSENTEGLMRAIIKEKMKCNDNN